MVSTHSTTTLSAGRSVNGFARNGGHPLPAPTPSPTQADAHVGAPRAGEASASSAAPRPTVATRTRYPALAGCPDLANHTQLVEAIGYHGLALRLSKRQKWTRVERAAIVAAVAKVQAEARTSLQRALEIWAEIQTARGLDALNMAQDAAALAETERAA